MNMDDEKPPLSRRDFLKLGGMAFAAAAFGPRSHEGDISVTEPFQIGNLNLTAILLEHHKESWEENGPRLIRLLESFPIVIPEAIHLNKLSS